MAPTRSSPTVTASVPGRFRSARSSRRLAGDEPLVMVNTFTPDLYVQYFRDLRQMVAAGEAPTPEAIARVMSRYATEVADDYAAE